MPHERRVIRLTEPATSRVRYGRAVLTICRHARLNGGALGGAIVAWERGELSSEELCQQFVRSRVREHTPSFNWDGADPKRLLRLVVAASQRPRFESADPAGVAQELARAAQEDADEFRRTMEKGGPPFRASTQVSALWRSARFDSLAGIKRAVAAATPTFGAAKLISDSSRSLVDSSQLHAVSPKLTNLARLGPSGSTHRLVSDNLAALRVASKAIDPKLFQAPGWIRTLPDPAPWLRRLREQTSSWIEASKRAHPRNWRELESEELDQVVELTKSEGLSLAWAPRPEIVRALLAAEGHAGRSAVLTRYRDEIIQDVEVVLDGVDRSDLRPVAQAGIEAIQTYRDGHPAPAQTYAAAAIGEVIHGPLGWESFGEVRSVFAMKDPRRDVGYVDLPLFAVGRALVRTLDRFDNAGDGFNRNLTQHRIGPPHSEANLLIVLMLLAGLLRELQRVLNRHDARQSEDAA